MELHGEWYHWHLSIGRETAIYIYFSMQRRIWGFLYWASLLHSSLSLCLSWREERESSLFSFFFWRQIFLHGRFDRMMSCTPLRVCVFLFFDFSVDLNSSYFSCIRNSARALFFCCWQMYTHVSFSSSTINFLLICFVECRGVGALELLLFFSSMGIQQRKTRNRCCFFFAFYFSMYASAVLLLPHTSFFLSFVFCYLFFFWKTSIALPSPSISRDAVILILILNGTNKVEKQKKKREATPYPVFFFLFWFIWILNRMAKSKKHQASQMEGIGAKEKEERKSEEL